MISLCQLDQRWSSLKLGNTNATIGRWGCTTTSICMIISKFIKDYPTPAEAARRFKYRSDGAIFWSSNFDPLKFTKRGYGKNMSEIEKYANGKKTGVIIAVNSDSHWLAVDSVQNGRVYVYDPINSNGRELLPTRYKISGYALFESSIVEDEIPNDSVIPEHAIESVNKAKDLGIMKKWGTPNADITAAEIEIIAQRLEVFKRTVLTGGCSRADFAVFLDRLGAFD